MQVFDKRKRKGEEKKKKDEDIKILMSLSSFNLKMTWMLIPYLAINNPGAETCLNFDDVSALQWGTGQRQRHGHQKPVALRRDVSPARAIAVWWGLDSRARGPNVTRQAETGMIQPCSKDGDREGERNARRGGDGCGRMGTQSTWRGRLKGDEKEQGEWAAGEMIMMGIFKKKIGSL